MLKFFREIRRKLIDGDERSEARLPDGQVLHMQNQGKALTERTTKRVGRLNRYLIYAIGEILLVVIGILIALQINNWNTNRILKNEMESTYRKLIFDMKNDYSSFVLQRDSLFQIFLFNATEMQNLIAQENSIEDIAKLRNFKGSRYATRLGNADLDYYNPTYTSIVNSGFIYQLEDSTNQLITTYYTLVEDVKANFEAMGIANRNVRDAEKLFPFQYILTTPDSIFQPSKNSLIWLNNQDSEYYQAAQYYLGFYIRQQKSRIRRIQTLIALNKNTREHLELLL